MKMGLLRSVWLGSCFMFRGSIYAAEESEGKTINVALAKRPPLLNYQEDAFSQLVKKTVDVFKNANPPVGVIVVHYGSDWSKLYTDLKEGKGGVSL